MQGDELDHIRADVHRAILEAQQQDPTVTLEILWRLFEQLGELARGEQGAFWAERWSPDAVLRDIQVRAVSKVPYGVPVDDDPPSDPEERL